MAHFQRSCFSRKEHGKAYQIAVMEASGKPDRAKFRHQRRRNLPAMEQLNNCVSVEKIAVTFHPEASVALLRHHHPTEVFRQDRKSRTRSPVRMHRHD